MQSIAAEFNLAETTFVLPPQDPTHTAQVRIFTPKAELPFAGHPNVGTAFVLARMGRAGDRFVFEEKAGLVPLDLTRENGAVVATRLAAPQPLTLVETVSARDRGRRRSACSPATSSAQPVSPRPATTSCSPS